MSDGLPKRGYEFEAIVAWLRELRANGYYGTIELGMQNGEISSAGLDVRCKPGEPFPMIKRREKQM